jgi:hypothetical protein
MNINNNTKLLYFILSKKRREEAAKNTEAQRFIIYFTVHKVIEKKL